MSLSSRLFTRVCIGGSGHCRLLGVDWLVRFDAPEMEGTRSARVDATVWRKPSRGGPVVEERYRVTLRRTGHEWTAERVEAVGSD
jgi:hypothetical protein